MSKRNINEGGWEERERERERGEGREYLVVSSALGSLVELIVVTKFKQGANSTAYPTPAPNVSRPFLASTSFSKKVGYIYCIKKIKITTTKTKTIMKKKKENKNVLLDIHSHCQA